jgi:hypothetical protein
LEKSEQKAIGSQATMHFRKNAQEISDNIPWL